MAQGIGLDHRCLHTPGQFSAPRGQPGEDRPGTAAVAAEVVTGATVSCERRAWNGAVPRPYACAGSTSQYQGLA